jgi:hypothetical protein
MSKLKWRIYYDDYTTFSSDDGTPLEAPPFGVIAIPFPNTDTGRGIVHYHDWYFWHLRDLRWWGSDIHGLLDLLLHNAPITAIKQGRSVSNTVFARIYARALADPDFPRKSATRAGEKP